MVYLDTNILIYLLEGTDQHTRRVAEVLERLKADGHEFATSVLTMTEFLAGTTGSTLSLLESLPHLTFYNFDREMAIRAGDLQRQSKLRIGDAVHLATALSAGCKILFTNDKRFAAAGAKHISVQGIR